MKLSKTLCAAIMLATISSATAAFAQCDGSADIPSNAMIDDIWSDFSNGTMQELSVKLDAFGVLNSGLENGLRSLKRQHPDGFSQCTVLLRNPISDRLFAEYVVIGNNDGVGFYAKVAVMRIGDTERVIHFSLDTKMNPEMFTQ